MGPIIPPRSVAESDEGRASPPVSHAVGTSMGPVTRGKTGRAEFGMPKDPKGQQGQRGDRQDGHRKLGSFGAKSMRGWTKGYGMRS